MEAIKRNTEFQNLQTRNLACNGAKLKESTMIKDKAKSTADIRENIRPILGEIHNVNRTKIDAELCKRVENKLSIGRKFNPFVHVKSKVDSNLHPINKTVIRRHQSCVNLDTKKIAQNKTIRSDKLKSEAKHGPKLILNPYLPKSKNEEAQEIDFTPELIKKLDMIEYADILNPLMVVEYKKDIYEYLMTLEKSDPVQQNFLQGKEINKKMREILISWLINVHTEFSCLLDTLHLTISILDRFLTKVSHITKDNYQLVGLCAMILACKYEEMYVPDIHDFMYVCQDAYNKQQIRSMEYEMLRTLKFNLSPPLPINFLRRFSKVANANPIHHAMSKFFVELLLFEYTTCYYKPSMMAAAAICLSFALLNKDPVLPSKAWTPALQYYSTYKYPEIDAAVKMLAKIIHKVATKDHAIAKKYADSKYMKVSKHNSLHSVIILKLVKD